MLISSTRRQAGDAPLVLYVKQLLPSTLRWVPLRGPHEPSVPIRILRVWL